MGGRGIKLVLWRPQGTFGAVPLEVLMHLLGWLLYQAGVSLEHGHFVAVTVLRDTACVMHRAGAAGWGRNAQD